VWLIYEKTEGRKSRETVPIKARAFQGKSAGYLALFG
jgi:hypothetical protein